MPGYRVYGVGLHSEHAFRLPLWRSPEPPELVLEYAADPLPEPLERQLVYRSPLRRPDGESVAVLHRLDDRELFSFPPDGGFVLTENRVLCRRPARQRVSAFETRFLGALMAYWLERRGVLSLHASAVEVDGRAVAFVAAHGGGKTSLAASFAAAGNPLLTDDLLAVRATRSGPCAEPGYPVMRMGAEQIERFEVDRRGLRRVDPRVAKWFVPIDRLGGAFQPSGLPLAAIFFLRMGAPERAVEVSPASASAAAIELVRLSFTPYVVEAVGLQRQRLERIGDLVDQVPGRFLDYPAGLDRLPESRRAVLAELSLLSRPC